jgi:beta-phosphoglucomutase-like phosphatase (HAD superfamily)
VDRHFAAHGLSDRFQAIITRLDCAEGKPHPEPYVRAAAALAIEPPHVLALEDSHAGVRSAHEAGCMTVMIPDLLPANQEMRMKALRVADSLHDIIDLVGARTTPVA